MVGISLAEDPCSVFSAGDHNGPNAARQQLPCACFQIGAARQSSQTGFIREGCVYALQDTVPHGGGRSSRRCLDVHGQERLRTVQRLCHMGGKGHVQRGHVNALCGFQIGKVDLLRLRQKAGRLHNGQRLFAGVVQQNHAEIGLTGRIDDHMADIDAAALQVAFCQLAVVVHADLTDGTGLRTEGSCGAAEVSDDPAGKIPEQLPAHLLVMRGNVRNADHHVDVCIADSNDIQHRLLPLRRPSPR